MSAAGLSELRLAHLRAMIEADIKRRLYHGAVIIVGPADGVDAEAE
jgi:hypothetical protein